MASLIFKLAGNIIQLNNYGPVKLRKANDPILRKPAREVDLTNINSEAFKTLIQEMIDIMRTRRGQGIAAPQVGIDLQIIAVEFTEQDYDSAVECYGKRGTEKREMRIFPLIILVNPKLRVINFEKTVFEEGCLSLDKNTGFVERYREVEIDGYNEKGDHVTFRASGWLSRILQHEVHHLKGLLISDYFVKTQSRYWKGKR